MSKEKPPLPPEEKMDPKVVEILKRHVPPEKLDAALQHAEPEQTQVVPEDPRTDNLAEMFGPEKAAQMRREAEVNERKDGNVD